MVTKIKKDEKKGKVKNKGRVKVGKLKLHKETLKDLTGSEAGQVRGGAAARLTRSPTCT